jgi:hypothetical protein
MRNQTVQIGEGRRLTAAWLNIIAAESACCTLQVAENQERSGRGGVREQREHPREKHWKRAENAASTRRNGNGNNYEGGQKQSALEVWLSLFYYLVCSGND